MFERLERPFYTIVDDYVIFSNNTETLLNLVEDHRQEQTLSHNDDFKNFRKNFSNKATVFAGFNSVRAFPLLRTFASAESWQSLQAHRRNVEGVRHLGLQLEAGEQHICKRNLRPDFESEHP